MQRTLLRRVFQQSTPDFIEYLEIFSNGDMEIAIYYRKNAGSVFFN